MTGQEGLLCTRLPQHLTPLMNMNTFASIQKLKSALPLITALLCLTTLTAFSQKPDLYVQTGHSGRIGSIAFSPDGQTLASAGMDSSIRLWSTVSGREMNTLRGHGRHLYSVAFSPDGKTLVSSSADFTIKLWDVATGRELTTLTGHAANVTSASFTPSGKTVISQDSGGTTKFWDVISGRELKTMERESEKGGLYAISPDGKTLAENSRDLVRSTELLSDGTMIGGLSKYDYSVKLTETISGKKLRTLSDNSDRPVKSIVFSPDSEMLAVVVDSSIKIWNANAGKKVRTINADGPADSAVFSADGSRLAASFSIITRCGTTGAPPCANPSPAGSGFNRQYGMRFWDIRSGREIGSIGTNRPARRLMFSPDGRTLAVGFDNNSLRFLEVVSGKELWGIKGSDGFCNSFAWSRDSKIFGCGGLSDSNIRLWDGVFGRQLTQMREQSNPVSSIAVSPGGQVLASGGWDSTVRLWNLDSDQQLRFLKGHRDKVSSVAFSKDARMLASGSWDRTIKLWDVSSGNETKTLKGHSDLVRTVTISPDSRFLASGASDKLVKVWDMQTGLELRTLKGHSSSVSSVAFSPDGRLLASGSADKSIKLWDADTGKELKTVIAHTGGGYSNASILFGGVYTVAFSPDGKTLASGGACGLAREANAVECDDAIKFWDVATMTEKKTPNRLSSSDVLSIAYSTDGKMLISGDSFGSSRLWDLLSGKEIGLWKDPSTVATSVTFSPDGRTIATAGLGSRVRLMDVASRNELVSLISLAADEWIVVDPNGLFDGSPSAWDKIIWRFSSGLYDFVPIEAFFNDFYYPGLLADVFGRKNPRAPSDISNKDRRQPMLKLTLTDIQSETALANRNLKVKIDISQAPAGARDVRLFRNGSLLKVWRGDVLKGQSSATLDATITIVGGANNLTAYAFNNDNVKSNDATLVAIGTGSVVRKGTAYVLAVGVNEYSNEQYNLAYAVADAKDFSVEFRREQEKLGNYARVEVIGLNDKDATKGNILNPLADLSAKVQPEDSVTIFFAGHGTAQQNRFYLIPHDLGYKGSRTNLDNAGLQTILSHSISDVELEAAVEGIDAGQMLLVIDACNSGQALEADEKRRGPMNSKGLAQLAYEKGMYILTAAQSYQAAKETAKLGHGYLTYALVEEGLKTPAADREPKDGQVLLREWLNFATERVPQMQQEDLAKRQLTQLTQEKGKTGNPGEKDNIQRPRVFYRRETEPHPFVVARP